MCSPGWPLPCTKSLVLPLQKSHLFSNSDISCGAKDLSVFVAFQPSEKKKKKKRECEGSLALNCFSSSGGLHQRLIFWVEVLVLTAE